MSKLKMPCGGAFVLSLALLGALALWVIYSNKLADKPIRSDGVGYYAYLPALFIHQDITLESFINRHFAGRAEEWMGASRFPETGLYLNRYVPGEAVLMLPFFLAAQAVSLLAGLRIDCLGWQYQIAAAAAGLFYMCAGLLLLAQSLVRHFSQNTTRLTLVLITFATNLFHYGTFDNIFSHVYSFFLFSALLWLTERWYETAAAGFAVLTGIAAGLIVAVRPTNALFLLFVPLLGLRSLRARLQFLREHRWQVLALGLSAILAASPLFLYWKIITGHWIVNSYVGLSFDFAHPQIINVLLSVRKGLFFWSPLLLLSVAGFFMVARYWKGFRLPAVIYLLGHTWIIASWPSWWYGGSFGHRAFTETLPVFAVGLAALLESLRKNSALFFAVLILCGLLTLLSLKLMIQYWLGIVPFDETTLELLISTFFRFSK